MSFLPQKEKHNFKYSVIISYPVYFDYKNYDQDISTKNPSTREKPTDKSSERTLIIKNIYINKIHKNNYNVSKLNEHIQYFVKKKNDSRNIPENVKRVR